MKVKSDHHSKLFSNLSNWKEEAWKISGPQRDSNLRPLRYGCDASPTMNFIYISQYVHPPIPEFIDMIEFIDVAKCNLG